MNPRQLEALKVMPYRLRAVAAFTDALGRVLSWDGPKTMSISFDGKLAIKGNSSAYTNPVIEAGVIHCRALLEFLGMAASEGKIVQRKKSREKRGDLWIENFIGENGEPLPLVTAAQALSHYEGDSREAEKALVAVFHTTNKGLAHVTSELQPPEAWLLEIAGRGVPAIVISHLYIPLGLPAPNYELGNRAD